MSDLNRRKWLILGALCLACWGIYLLYPRLLPEVLALQKQFNQQLSEQLRALPHSTLQAGLGLILLSFLYGIFHALGPGHGKVILSSYLALEKTQLKQALKITFASSLLQALVAVLSVSIIIVAFTLSRRYLNLTIQWVERGSFILMITLGLYWAYQAFRAYNAASKTPKIRQIRPLAPTHVPLAPPHFSHNTTQCSCGHHHTPSVAQMQRSQNWQSRLMLIVSMGIRPCSGAILMLFLAYTLNLYPWGVVSTFAMSLGTAITLSLFAAVVLFARRQAVGLSRWYVNKRLLQMLPPLIKSAAALLLIGLGSILLHATFIEQSAPFMFRK